MPSFAVSTELSVPVSESDSEKIISQVPQMLQEAEVISNVKQNSVPPPQSKWLFISNAYKAYKKILTYSSYSNCI